MATPEGGNVSREDRRRRIAARGSDRLALITGRIQSLPSDSDTPLSTSDARPADDSSQNISVPSTPTLPEANQNPDRQDVLTKKPEPSSRSPGKGNDIVSRAMGLLDIADLSQVASSVQNSILNTQNQQQNHHQNTLTTAQISSMVSDSENTRLICSVLVGLLVTLSSANFPILGWNIVKKTLLLRPVFLLFLTNMSIVFGRLTLEARGSGFKEWLKRSVPRFGGNDLVEQLGKAFEVALLLQKILGGLLIDFCIYAIVLVCGLSVMRVFGL